MGVIVAQNVEHGTMTSLPWGRLRAKYIAVMALVPLKWALQKGRLK
jgi:hypothetical protein